MRRNSGGASSHAPPSLGARGFTRRRPYRKRADLPCFLLLFSSLPVVTYLHLQHQKYTHNTIGFNFLVFSYFCSSASSFRFADLPPFFCLLLFFYRQKCRQKSGLCGTATVGEELEKEGAAARGVDLPSFGLGELAAGEGSSWEGKMTRIGVAAGSSARMAGSGGRWWRLLLVSAERGEGKVRVLSWFWPVGGRKCCLDLGELGCWSCGEGEPRCGLVCVWRKWRWDTVGEKNGSGRKLCSKRGCWPSLCFFYADGRSVRWGLREEKLLAFDFQGRRRWLDRLGSSVGWGCSAGGKKKNSKGLCGCSGEGTANGLYFWLGEGKPLVRGCRAEDWAKERGRRQLDV